MAPLVMLTGHSITMALGTRIDQMRRSDELAGGTASKSSLKSVLEKDPAPLKDGP